jgi:hypothetical protein
MAWQISTAANAVTGVAYLAITYRHPAKVVGSDATS